MLGLTVGAYVPERDRREDGKIGAEASAGVRSGVEDLAGRVEQLGAERSGQSLVAATTPVMFSRAALAGTSKGRGPSRAG